MSIKLTKMYTISYTQRPNNYFTQSLRHFVGVDMDLRVWRRLDLAVDEFSRHEAGELVVANRYGRWIRNLSKITSQLFAFTCKKTENQDVVFLFLPRCHVHHVYPVYSFFITYQW